MVATLPVSAYPWLAFSVLFLFCRPAEEKWEDLFQELNFYTEVRGCTTKRIDLS